MPPGKTRLGKVPTPPSSRHPPSPPVNAADHRREHGKVTQSCETFLGRGRGRGLGSVLRVPFSRVLGRAASGLGGSAGGSGVTGMDRL